MFRLADWILAPFRIELIGKSINVRDRMVSCGGWST